ncbi:MAG: ATP-binding protein [Patescibacteria group bacterium]
MEEILNLLNPWWFGKAVETGIERVSYLKKLEKSLMNKRAVLLVGSRRVGKTTMFHQFIKKLLKKTSSKHVLYALMDHPQLSTRSILELVHEFRKMFATDRSAKLYIFLDEIQYVKDWERQVKSLVDTENVKIFLSGSASSQLLLKSHYLTGRIEKIEADPLDFGEFLIFKKAKSKVTESYKAEKLFEEYLALGGYPEYVLRPDPSYFADLVNNILYKDIVSMYQLRNPDLLKDLLLLLADRSCHHATYTKLASVLSLKNDTVKEYVYYLKNTLLVDELPRYSASRSHRIYGPKKFYVTDNGLLFHLLGRLSRSAAFERTLFQYLKRRAKGLGFYYENQQEVDFVSEESGKRVFWEAKYELPRGYELELDRYLAAAKSLDAAKIIFVTKSFAKKEKINDITVEWTPLWRLLV